MASVILYLHAKVFDAGICAAELTGMRRHAAAHGWEVREVALDEKHLEPALRKTLHNLRPLGCVVQSGGRLNPPPRLFGTVPVVYVEPSRELCRQGVAHVMADNAEIARFAFRELMSGHPEALAFIGGRWNRIWSRERGSAFATLVREAKLPFFPFPHRKESDAARDARLHAFVRDLFVKFFVTVLKRLKGEFPEIRVGGPGMNWMKEDYFSEIFAACREAGVAPDFISWHHYHFNPDVIMKCIDDARRLCDRFGFRDCELFIDEWHYQGDPLLPLNSPDPAVRRRLLRPGPHVRQQDSPEKGRLRLRGVFHRVGPALALGKGTDNLGPTRR